MNKTKINVNQTNENLKEVKIMLTKNIKYGDINLKKQTNRVFIDACFNGFRLFLKKKIPLTRRHTDIEESSQGRQRF